MNTPQQPEDPESIAASEAANKADPAGDARRWLLTTTSGTLCSHSARHEGFPFGSVVPFALTADGRPVILTANIAQHTKNLVGDPRASLFVQQPGLDGDPQKGWRITVMGTWARVTNDAVIDEVHARYLQRVPSAESYLRVHNFAYWQMTEVTAVRYIAGFGKICWLDGSDILRDPMGGGLSDAAGPAITHMNDDHADSMREMCLGLYGLQPEGVQMTRLDATGFFVRTERPNHELYFPFEREVDAAGIRKAVIDVLVRARSAR